MATVMYIPEHRQNRFAMRAVINYCQQEYKTYDNKSKRQLISGVNCDGANSFREFMATKKVYGKDNGFFFYSHRKRRLRPNRHTKSLWNLLKRRGQDMKFWLPLTATGSIFIRTSSSIPSALNQERS